MKNADTPASACTIDPHPDSIAQAVGCGAPVSQRRVYTGLTKREAFAMAAMAAILSNPNMADYSVCPDMVSKQAFKQADSMLKEPKE